MKCTVLVPETVKDRSPSGTVGKTRSGHVVMGIRLLNKLPLAVTDLDFKNFKNRLFLFLVNNPLYRIDDFFSMPDKLIKNI